MCSSNFVYLSLHVSHSTTSPLFLFPGKSNLFSITFSFGIGAKEFEVEDVAVVSADCEIDTSVVDRKGCSTEPLIVSCRSKIGSEGFSFAEVRQGEGLASIDVAVPNTLDREVKSGREVKVVAGVVDVCVTSLFPLFAIKVSSFRLEINHVRR